MQQLNNAREVFFKAFPSPKNILDPLLHKDRRISRIQSDWPSTD